jgi:D-alanyl-D-alanine carboxypeptidase
VPLPVAAIATRAASRVASTAARIGAKATRSAARAGARTGTKTFRAAARSRPGGWARQQLDRTKAENRIGPPVATVAPVRARNRARTSVWRALRAGVIGPDRSGSKPSRRRGRHARRRIRRIVRLSIVLLPILSPVVVLLVAVAAVGGTEEISGAGVSAVAERDLPAEALAAYQEAAGVWRIDWSILAAVGKVECDHGRAQLSGCNPPETMNGAGARGYMQFLGSTWRRGLGQREMEPRSSPAAADGQGYATDGDGDGDADPWSWPDATHSAARYLVSLGVARNPDDALYGYNHSQAYVTEVMGIAMSYRASGGETGATSYEGTPGSVPLSTVEGITVHSQIAPQVAGLVQAARADGFALTGGGYRSPQRQIELRRQHCGTSQYAIYEMPSSQCNPPTARPGASNHELGLAVDFSCNGALIRSRSDSCFAWMSANAGRFGLRNLPSEPWHWSVDGA